MSHYLSYRDNLKNDLPAGLVVFLVAVPLCLGIALASGAPLFSGIIAGVIGGIVVGFISKSALGVSGPAAGLAIIVLTAIGSLGSYEVFLLAVFVSGFFQICLGLIKAGIVAYYFPSSVIKGMLSGIGVIIFLKQIPHIVGYDKSHEGDFSFIQSDGHTTFSELYYMFDSISIGAIIISVFSIIILISWESPFFKSKKLFNIIQGPLVVVVGGILLNLLFKNTSFSLNPEQIVNIPVPENYIGFLKLFTFPDFSAFQNPLVYKVGAVLAIVASLETLLSVEAGDKLDVHKRITPTNRELIAQGIGNMFSGLVGGLPITQVIVRSSTNVQSGGKTKVAAISHGVFLLLCVFFIPQVINLIPLSCLAAILIVVGYKLAKPQLFICMYKLGLYQFIPFIITVVGVVLTDLLQGIIMGLGVSIVYILYKNFQTPYYFHEDEYENTDVIRIELAQDVSFMNKASILTSLDHLPERSKVIIDCSKSVYIDLDVKEIILDFKETAKIKKIDYKVLGLEDTESINHLENFKSKV